MTDQPANINLRLALDQAALQQSSQGVGKLNQQFNDLKSQTRSSGTSADNALRGIVSDASAATNEIKKLNSALESTSKTAASVKSGGFGIEGLRRTGGALSQLGLGDIGQPIQRLGDFKQVIDEIGIAGNGAGIALGPATLALGGIALAVGVFKKVLDDASQPLADAVTKTEAYYKAIETGTTESLTAELKALEVHKKILDEQQKTLQAAYDAAHPASQADKPGEGHDIFSDFGKVFSNVSNDVSSGGKELNKSLEDTKSQAKQTQLQIDALKEALKSEQVATNDATAAHNALHKEIGEFADTGAKAAAEELKKLNEEVRDTQKAAQERAQKEVDVVKKLDDQLAALDESSAQERIDISTRLHDALVKAAEDALEASQKALDQLTQKREQNFVNLQRDNEQADRESANKELETRIAVQRQERDDLAEHLNNLRQIRDRDQSRERDDLLNRNYRDLFALREQKTQDMNSENGRYSEQQNQRKQALADQLSDLKRGDQQQRQERLIAYQQANADALKQYNIELQNAAEAKRKAIQLAQQSAAKELNELSSTTSKRQALLHQSALNELKLVTQTEQTKQQIFQQYLDRARQMLGEATTASGSAFNSPRNISQATPFASGGPISAYQTALVNEPGSSGNEGFNGVKFPRSMGLFTPFKSGNIQRGGSGNTTVPISIEISGVSDPVAVWRFIEPRIERKVKEAVG